MLIYDMLQAEPSLQEPLSSFRLLLAVIIEMVHMFGESVGHFRLQVAEDVCHVQWWNLQRWTTS